MKCSRCHSKKKKNMGEKNSGCHGRTHVRHKGDEGKVVHQKLCKEEAPRPPSKVWDGYRKELRLVEIYDHTSVLVFADCIWPFLFLFSFECYRCFVFQNSQEDLYFSEWRVYGVACNHNLILSKRGNVRVPASSIIFFKAFWVFYMCTSL